MSTVPNEVPSLVIPLSEYSLLVPNSCVAEIVPGTAVDRRDEHPWLIGKIEWRELTLPCISFEHLSGTISSDVKVTQRVAIFNTISDAFSMRFYAVAIHGIPRLARVVQEELVEEAVEPQAFDKLKAQLNGESCTIPDLAAIENLLASISLD